MAEIGLIASVIQVAGAGLKLADTLYQYAEAVSTADRRIKDIARDVKLTSRVIDELGSIFKQDETALLLSNNAVSTAQETVRECSSLFEEMDAALKKTKKNTLGRFMMPFREPKMELLRANIDRLKSTLQLLMQVLTHAYQVASHKAPKEVVAVQRHNIKVLIKAKKESTKRYQESLRSYSMSDESTVLNDDEISINTKALGTSTEKGSGFVTTASSISSTITKTSLASCVAHIQKLLNDIELVQHALNSNIEGEDASEHEQALVGSYFSARKHLDTIILGGSGPGRTDSGLSEETLVTPQGRNNNQQENAAMLAPPPEETKPAVKFVDAIGRKFAFPWQSAKSWSATQGLINAGFAPIEGLNEHVEAGHYDLVGPDGEIILPQIWETFIEPGMTVKMEMWPIPPPPPPLPPAMGPSMPGPLDTGTSQDPSVLHDPLRIPTKLGRERGSAKKAIKSGEKPKSTTSPLPPPPPPPPPPSLPPSDLKIESTLAKKTKKSKKKLKKIPKAGILWASGSTSPPDSSAKDEVSTKSTARMVNVGPDYAFRERARSRSRERQTSLEPEHGKAKAERESVEIAREQILRGRMEELSKRRTNLMITKDEARRNRKHVRIELEMDHLREDMERMRYNARREREGEESLRKREEEEEAMREELRHRQRNEEEARNEFEEALQSRERPARSRYQFEPDDSLDEDESNLDAFLGATKRLSALARVTGQEVDTQNTSISRIVTKTDKVDDQIALNRQRLDRIGFDPPKRPQSPPKPYSAQGGLHVGDNDIDFKLDNYYRKSKNTDYSPHPKADIFEAKIANAVDDNTSDSESFVFTADFLASDLDAAPSQGKRQHSPAPAAAAVSGLVEYGSTASFTPSSEAEYSEGEELSSPDIAIDGEVDDAEAVPPPSQPAPKLRKRTKTGCLTCRKQRIKCGEERPICNNCIDSKRLCEGYNQRVVFRAPTGEWPNHPSTVNTLPRYSSMFSGARPQQVEEWETGKPSKRDAKMQFIDVKAGVDEDDEDDDEGEEDAEVDDLLSEWTTLKREEYMEGGVDVRGEA